MKLCLALIAEPDGQDWDVPPVPLDDPSPRTLREYRFAWTDDVGYERLGWQVVEGPLTFDQPEGKATWPAVAMVLPCGGREWPEGVIDLCGRPW